MPKWLSLWLRRRTRRRARRYDVFISYSHQLDRGLAPGIEAGLQKLAKPWYRRHALRVFRDSSDLGAEPALWRSIRSALVRSRHFVLLASPHAARSSWVNREVKLWLRLNGTRRLYLAITEGDDPVWGVEAGTRAEADPIPAALAAFPAPEPLWVNFRGVRGDSEFRRDNEALRTAIARLVAPIRNMTPAELIGEDYRQFRRTIRIAWSAVIALATLLISTFIAAYFAEIARQQAVHQAALALARQLAAQADVTSNAANNPQDPSALLAIESLSRAPTLEGNQALQKALATLPVARLPQKGDVVSEVASVVFSADSRYLATMGRVTAHVFDTSTHKELVRLKHPAIVDAIQFSPDARYLATADRNNTVRVVDIGTGKVCAVVEHPDWVLSGAFSADSRSFITASRDNIVRIVDAATGKATRQLTLPGPVYTLTTNGQLAGIVDDQQVVRLIETTRSEEVARFPHPSGANRLEISPDARYLATIDGDNTFRVFEIATGTERFSAPFRATLQSHISSVAFSPDGQFVAIGVGHTARVFALGKEDEPGRVGNEREVARVEHNGDVHKIAFSADSRYLATGSSDQPHVRVFDLTKAKQVWASSHEREVFALDFSGDGRYLAVGGDDGALSLFDAVTGEAVARITSRGSSFSVDIARESSRLIAASWDVARIVDAVSGKEVRRHELNGPLQVAVSIDGGHAVAVNALHAIVFEIDSGREVGRIGVSNLSWLTSVAISHEGRFIALGGADGTHVFESATGKAIERLTGSGSHVALSADGKLLATDGGTGGGALVIDTASGRQVAQLTQRPRVSALSFDRTGNYIAAGSFDQNVSVFDVTTGREILELPHGAALTSVAFSADGRFLATGTSDGIARVFETSSGIEVAHIDHDEGIQTVGFVGSDRLLVVATYDGIVRRHLWRSKDLIDEGCRRLSKNFDRAEWSRYFGTIPYAKTCPNIP